MFTEVVAFIMHVKIKEKHLKHLLFGPSIYMLNKPHWVTSLFSHMTFPKMKYYLSLQGIGEVANCLIQLLFSVENLNLIDKSFQKCLSISFRPICCCLKHLNKDSVFLQRRGWQLLRQPGIHSLLAIYHWHSCYQKHQVNDRKFLP